MMPLEWYIVPAAFTVDLAAGDPRSLPHPVVWMGRAAERLEPLFRKMASNQVLCGAVFALFLIAAAWGGAFAALKAAYMISPWAGRAANILLLFYCLSAATLCREAMAVKSRLETDGVEAAKEKLAFLVGRDVAPLDREGVIRATVETVAENFVDGVLSPLFFAVIGGVPCAVAYKMINTLDSMVGYRNEKYMAFGRVPARIDDAANFIPARMSVLLAALAAGLINPGRGMKAVETGFREGRRHKSPNAGFPEAAFAGALRMKLGGPGIYHGKQVEKPFIGEGFTGNSPFKIKMACDLMLLTSLLSVTGATVCAVFIGC